MSKRRSYYLIIAMVCSLLLAACTPDPASHERSNEKVVNVYSWADYIAPTTIDRFEAEYGIKVNYDFYDSSEMVDAKLLAGSSGYDVVMHSGQFAARLIPLGIFTQLDKTRFDNLDSLDPAILEQISTYDRVNDFGMPYMWGSTGFSYNVDMLQERIPDIPFDSGEILFNPEVVSKLADCGVTFLDSATDVLPMALAHLGLDPNSIDERSISQAEKLISDVRPYVRYFSSTKMLMDLPNKEVCVAMSWSGDYASAAARAKEAGIDINLQYSVPGEGGALWFDSMFIPIDAPHLDNAYLFINFVMRPDIIAEITNHINYANAVLTSAPYLRPEVLKDPAIYPDEAMMEILYPVIPVEPKLERIRNRAWARIKSGI